MLKLFGYYIPVRDFGGSRNKVVVEIRRYTPATYTYIGYHGILYTTAVNIVHIITIFSKH